MRAPLSTGRWEDAIQISNCVKEGKSLLWVFQLSHSSVFSSESHLVLVFMGILFSLNGILASLQYLIHSSQIQEGCYIDAVQREVMCSAHLHLLTLSHL